MELIPAYIVHCTHCLCVLPRSDPAVSSVKAPTDTGKANATHLIDLRWGEKKKIPGLSKYECYCPQIHPRLPQVQHTSSN